MAISIFHLQDLYISDTQESPHGSETLPLPPQALKKKSKIQKPKSSQALRKNENKKQENTIPALTTCRLVRIIPRRLSTTKPVA